MTFAPASLLAVRRVFKTRFPHIADAELGIVGGPSHIQTGTSYHLGADQLKMSRNPYSARTTRDKAGLSNAASAFDITDRIGPPLLRELSQWLVTQCRVRATDTLDVREIIFSPNGIAVLTWDRERGVTSYPMARGDSSHRTHTHVSWYRDSEFRDRAAVFERFFQVQTQDEKVIDMFFLKLRTDPAIWVSDGLNVRPIPGGQWEITCVPLINSGVPLLEYDTMEQLFGAGGPQATGTTPITDEQLERVLRKTLGSLG